MRILIDLQGAQSASRFRGIGRYCLSLALAMVRNRGNHDIQVLLNGMLSESIRPLRDALGDLLPQNAVHVWHAVPPVHTCNPDNDARRAIAAHIRADAIRQLRPDVVHITSLFDGFGDEAVHGMETTGALHAVTFYDAIPLLRAEQYLDPDPVYRRHYMGCLSQMRRADLLLAISESSRQEAVTHVDVPAAHVVNISSAADACFVPIKAGEDDRRALCARLGITQAYIMYSGATDERKNHRGLIEAYAMLPAAIRQTHQLVLAGGLPDEHRQQLIGLAHAHGLRSAEMVITGRISDAELVLLYNHCALYVFASYHEGFGLPALEAMACGAATIGANTTSVPEVIGWDQALFDPHSPADMARKMQEALSHPAFHAALKAHALKQAAHFSWDESAQRAIAAFEVALSQPRRSTLAANNLINIVAPLAAQGNVDLLALSQAIARNAQPSKPQLLVDVSELIKRDARTGIQRVVRSILSEWLNNPPQEYEVRAVHANLEKRGYYYADAFTQRFMNRTEAAQPDSPIDYAHGDVFLALDMQPQVQVFQAPFYQHLRDCGVKVSFVLYDLLPITMPQYFPDGAQANHTQWVSVAAQSDAVLCISRSVADEFRGWLRVHQPQTCPQVDWFHMGADLDQSAPSAGLPPEAAETLAKLGKRPSFLLVGTMEPRKGQTDALDAAEALWASEDFNLIIVGKQGWKVDELVERIRNHPELNQRLFWLNGISDEYLAQVYAHADCLMAASFGEGFGLPLIEAAQRQIPLLVRDIPVFREVAGDHAYYFDAHNSGALQAAMQSWMTLSADHQAPQSKEMPWMTWAQSASQLLARTTGVTS